MGWFSKKPKCDHEWHETHIEDCMGLFGRSYKIYHIYCPKCDEHRNFEDSEDIAEWKACQKAQEIKKKYLAQGER